MNEISMPISVPLQLDLQNQEAYTENQSSVKIYNALREKLSSSCSKSSSGGNNETLMNNSNFGSSQSTIFEAQCKLDIYKTMYDYFYYTILNKYYVFYVDVSEASNARELQALNFRTAKVKANFNMFKLSELSANEQYKSTLALKCYKCISIDNALCVDI